MLYSIWSYKSYRLQRDTETEASLLYAALWKAVLLTVQTECSSTEARVLIFPIWNWSFLQWHPWPDRKIHQSIWKVTLPVLLLLRLSPHNLCKTASAVFRSFQTRYYTLHLLQHNTALLIPKVFSSPSYYPALSFLFVFLFSLSFWWFYFIENTGLSKYEKF